MNIEKFTSNKDFMNALYSMPINDLTQKQIIQEINLTYPHKIIMGIKLAFPKLNLDEYRTNITEWDYMMSLQDLFGGDEMTKADMIDNIVRKIDANETYKVLGDYDNGDYIARKITRPETDDEVLEKIAMKIFDIVAEHYRKKMTEEEDRINKEIFGF